MRRKPSSALNLAEHHFDNEAWYIKKVSGLGVIRTPIIAGHGTKQRRVEDILGLSSLSWKNSHKQGGLVYTGHESNARSQTSLPVTQVTEGDGKELEDVDNMTLQEMQSLLRKGKNSLLHNTLLPGGCNQVCRIDGSSSLQSEAPFIGLELLWEDSTSNSADTSDSGSFGGNSSSCNTPEGILDCLSGHISTNVDVAEGKERRFTDSTAIICADVDENEEWTLQKWQQTYHRKHFRHQRSSRKPETYGKVSQDDPCKASLVLQLGTTMPDCSQARSAGEICKAAEENIEPNTLASKEADRVLVTSNEKRSALKGASSGVSSPVSAPLLTNSSVRLELEDESASSTALWPERLQVGQGSSTWSLKGCSNVSTSSAFTQFRAYESSNGHTGRAYARLCRQESDSKAIEDNAAFVDAAGCPEAAPLKDSHNTKGAHISRSTSKELAYCMLKASVEAHNPGDTLVSCGACFERSEGLKPSVSYESHVSTKDCEALSGLNAMDSFEIEEECQLKPTKIPCKRKAISPLSQELLLKASRLGEFGGNKERAGMKWSPHVLKECSVAMDSSERWVNVCKRKTVELDGDPLANTTDKGSQEDDASNGSPCHIWHKTIMSRALKSSKGSNLLEPMPSDTRKKSFPLHSSPSPLQSTDKPRDETLSAQTSPPVPAKGILKSLSQGCQGPCCCEECMSVRARAERASEFSQRQMQDIEGLAVKLMKDLNILRGIVEERLIHSPSIRPQSPRPPLSIDQVRKATVNALETEETAKKWLVRMARDCNRYCKIMRMQERKLSFADESGGMLCHVKVFHLEPKSGSSNGGGRLHGEPSEAIKCSSSAMQQQPAVVSLQEGK